MRFVKFFQVSSLRLIAGLAMIVEAGSWRWDPSLVSHQIGDGWGWQLLFVLSGLGLIWTAWLPPGRFRVGVAMLPIFATLLRAEQAIAAGISWASGGVTTRIMLALFMAASLGWSTTSNEQFVALVKAHSLKE